MKHVKSALLTLAFVLGLVAGVSYAPSSEAAGGCYYDDCNLCCQKPDGSIICTVRICE